MLLSSAYTKSRTFQLLMQPCQQGEWGCTRSCEGAQPGDLIPAVQRDVPYHGMASCSAYKAGSSWPGGGGCSSGTAWASVSRCWTTAPCITCFVHFFIIITISPSFSALLNCGLFLKPWILLFFSDPLTHPTVGEVSAMFSCLPD